MAPDKFIARVAAQHRGGRANDNTGMTTTRDDFRTSFSRLFAVLLLVRLCVFVSSVLLACSVQVLYENVQCVGLS